MIKSGLILGGVMFLFVLMAAAIVSPLCALCVPFLTGLGAGYLTGVFEKPAISADATRRGAMAGTIAGGIGIVAQISAAIINSMVMQNPQYQIGQLFGGQAVPGETVWALQIGIALCIGLLNVGISAGMGAGGGAIWANAVLKKPDTRTDLTP